MATYTVYPNFVNERGDTTSVPGHVLSLGISLPSNEYPVSISFQNLRVQNRNEYDRSGTLYLCNTSGGNYYALQSYNIGASNGSVYPVVTFGAKSGNWTKLIGQSLAIGHYAYFGVWMECRSEWVTVTTATKPSVSQGSIITKAQMDALRNFKGSGNVVAQGGVIYASDGNTYRSGLTAGTTVIDDAWYNGA